jgi:valyl-tRNA synthetase
MSETSSLSRLDSLPKHYDPSQVEDKWYQHWLDQKYFRSEVDDREPFTIVIPPPNVTGVLHMGHILNNTIQDILIRRARLMGKNALWVPGSDHASIATEAKVVRMLREQGIKKSDLSRDEFMEHAWAWKEKYGGIIFKQLQKLGASCDWDRTRFTMEPKLTEAVIKVFCDLYEKGYIFRGLRMVNWDPQAQTTLSNEEVIHRNVKSKLYYVRYKIEGSEDHVVIATTRPETILGDTALAFHPEDERYAPLKGKCATVPLINRSIPIIYDTYIDREFGSGGLKVTPAHDPNDYEIGEKHGLESIDVLNADGTLSEAAGMYIGMDRAEARKKIVEDLEAAGLLEKVEDLDHSVGFSERTDAVVEPRLSLQWFLNMEELVKPAIEVVESGEVRLIPDKFMGTYRHWMNNIRHWCISRQLWWGQRIPAYYYGEGAEDFVVAENAELALEKARTATGNADLSMADLRQDEDVLDTWASSWLWPISVFDGFEEDQTEVNYYYPTNVLVTGPDILFFWVARMIIAGMEYRGEKPFEHVYLTGMVRDKQRRKMSKSLGNSPDPLAIIDEYGADAMRVGMLIASSAGNDILFDMKLCEQGRNFANKIWNALRLIHSWEVDDRAPGEEQMAINWFEEALASSMKEINRLFEEFRISEALKMLYSFIWDDFCSWYLEFVKPAYGEAISAESKEKTLQFFEQLMQILHPFMPFISEEIWHFLRDREAGDDLVVSSWPAEKAVNAEILKQADAAKDVISKLRDLRNKQGIGFKTPLQLFAVTEDFSIFEGFKSLIQKLGGLESFDMVAEEEPGSLGFLSSDISFFVRSEAESGFDLEAEKERIQKELEYNQGFLKSVQKKLSNERFVQNAPEAVVAKEKQKEADALQRLQALEDSLRKLN